jgi:hypothetical protein
VNIPELSERDRVIPGQPSIAERYKHQQNNIKYRAFFSF